jgi:predicted nucleotidyltransferase
VGVTTSANCLFGSVLRQDFRPDSDVDVLVEFEPDHGPAFIALHEMEEELSALLGGRTVELVTERFSNRSIRDRVLAGAEVQYSAR